MVYAHELTTTCPYCAAARTYCAPVMSAGGLPEDGDLSVCWDCRGVGRYVVGPLGRSVRALSPAELDEELRTNPELRRALAAAAESYDVAGAVGLLGQL